MIETMTFGIFIFILCVLPFALPKIIQSRIESGHTEYTFRIGRAITFLISILLSLIAIIGSVGLVHMLFSNPELNLYIVSSLFAIPTWLSFMYIVSNWVISRKVSKNILNIAIVSPIIAILPIFPLALFALPVIALNAYVIYWNFHDVAPVEDEIPQL